MWFLTVQTIPKPNEISTADLDGAAVHCWINFPEFDAATQLANFYLDREGWLVTNVEFSEWVEISRYQPEDVGYKYATEAQNSGASFLIQAYSPEIGATSVISDYKN